MFFIQLGIASSDPAPCSVDGILIIPFEISHCTPETNERDFGEGSASFAGFPDQPSWFRDNRDFSNIALGLKDVGFSDDEVAAVMGNNWLNFFESSFGPIIN